MADRRQLPPQIKRIELTRRAGARTVVRYQLTVDVGTVDGKRKQLRKRYVTEREARQALDEIRGEVAKGTYVHPWVLTVEDACTNWLMSRHGIKPKSKSGFDGVLAPVRAELGHLPVQKLTRRDVDGLVTRLRHGQVARADGTKRRPWSARPESASTARPLSRMTPNRKNSHRVLPIPDPLLVELKTAKSGRPRTTDTRHRPRRPRLSKMWAHAVAAAGVPRIRLHDARQPAAPRCTCRASRPQ